MTTTVTDRTAPAATSDTSSPTLGWALRRALLGFAILFAAMGSIAVLMYASIDPALDQELLEQNAKSLVLPISTSSTGR